MKKNTIILVNDTDHLSYAMASQVFGILNSWNIPFTHATFYTLDDEDEIYHDQPGSLLKHCYKRETASFTDEDKEKYISLLNHQIGLGNEIAYHGYSQISNNSKLFKMGIDEINKNLKEKMVTYIEHGGNPKFHPIQGCKRETLEIEGAKEDSEYFVKDLIKENFNQSWCYFDLVNPRNNLGLEGLTEALKEETFYKKDDLELMKRYRAKDVASLFSNYKVIEKDVIIAYTHFGYTGYPKGTLLESWYTYQDIQRNCQFLNSLRDLGHELTTIRKFRGN